MRILSGTSRWLAVWLAACGGDDHATPPDGGQVADAGGPDANSAPAEDWTRDVLATGLELDLTTYAGRATIDLAPSTTSTSASFDVAGLDVTGVSDTTGQAVFMITSGRLDVAVPPGAAPPQLTIDYSFTRRPANGFDGYLTSNVTFLWPTFCGNLFPCKPDPDDGSTFTLTVTGVPAGDLAVFPGVIPGDAPTYMPAIAHGDYVKEILGTTTLGTTVNVWYFTGDGAAAMTGTADMVAWFDWYEQTYGPYLYGSDVGSVSANWGPGAYGGMEHHPYWHVARGAMSDPVTHAHEAAHGWFGNGVRIRCWEDFVLSEGTVSYMAARAIEEAGGTAAGDAVWADYQAELDYAVANGDTIAWPDTCNAIDIISDPLWSSIPYMKGAFFYRAVEQQVGRPALDAALAAFYSANAGRAAGMADMLAAIQGETGFDPTTLADGWLRSLGTP